VPCHHNLEKYLDQYIMAAGIADDPDGPLFRTVAGKSGRLTRNPMWQQDAYRMIQRRAAAAGIRTRIGCHTFRATGITAYLQNGGKLEHAQQIAAHHEALWPHQGRDFARRGREDFDLALRSERRSSMLPSCAQLSDSGG
jgi:integrase/recombinase XerD